MGSRKNALDHLETAYLNGFSPLQTGCHVLIGDGLKGTDETLVPINGEYVKEAKIGSAIMDADIFISLTHFKGHEMAGFGGAIKNIGMGCGSRAGKMEQHCEGKPSVEKVDACVGCGQCAVACPTGAIMPKSDIKRVWDAIADPNVKTVVQVAPAVRVAMGNMEGVKDGANVDGKIFAALRKMGFDEVYDTSFSADITVIEESKEFLERLNKGGKLPIITSCCPGWIQYCEKKPPNLLENVSTCRSPMQMFASLIKEERKEKGKELFHVAVMPCTAKKFEAEREEFKKNGIPNVDAVITSEEFTHMLREAGILLSDLAPEPVDAPYDRKSGAGVIFGVTGGVTEAVLRNVVEEKSRGTVAKIAQVGVRGNEGIKEFEIGDDDSPLKIAVVSGLANAEKVLQRVEKGEHFDVIEVMACPGGCVAGGGQPFVHAEVRQKRGKGLYDTDSLLSLRHSENNPAVKAAYDRVLKGREHQLLHVHYTK